jgi:hypothetical protein
LPHSESPERIQENMITKTVLLHLLWRGGRLAYEVTFLSVYLSKHLSPFQWHIQKPLVSRCMCITPYRGTQQLTGLGTMLQAGRSRVRFPMRSLDFFNLPNPSSHTMALRSTQHLTEMSTGIFTGVTIGQHVGLTTSLPSLSWLSRISGSLDILLPNRSPRPITGIALPRPFIPPLPHHCKAMAR